MMDYIDLQSRGLRRSTCGSVTQVIDDSLFPCKQAEQ